MTVVGTSKKSRKRHQRKRTYGNFTTWENKTITKYKNVWETQKQNRRGRGKICELGNRVIGISPSEQRTKTENHSGAPETFVGEAG